MTAKVYVCVLIIVAAGCAAQSPYDRSYVSGGIEKRSDYKLSEAPQAGKFSLPEGVLLGDGLSEDEAVTVALSNNAQFQADLTALGFTNADLIEANMLPNPVFSLLFPVGPKLLEADLQMPIEALWQRPRRIAAAEISAQAISENLVEHGLGLIRDVQTTYADLCSARQQARLADEALQLQVRITELAQAQLKAGEISYLAASEARVNSLRATDVARNSSKEATLLKHRLHSLLGLVSDEVQFDLVPSDTAPKTNASLDELSKTALMARPDLRAAELAIEAAGKRLGWEKSKVYNLIAIIDAKDEGEDSLTVGPGLAVEVPIFDQNKGGIARAKAEMEQAIREYEAVRQNIIFQVRQAHTQYVSAQDEFELWNNHIIPSLQDALEQTEGSLAAGEVPYISLLEAREKLIEARMHKAELVAQLHRTAAELNYSVGRKML